MNLSIEALIAGLRFTPHRNTANLLHIAYVGSSFLATQLFYLGTYFSVRNQRKKLIARQDINGSSLRDIESRLGIEKRLLVTVVIVCFVLALTLLPSTLYNHIISFLPDNCNTINSLLIGPYRFYKASTLQSTHLFIYSGLPKYRRTNEFQ